MINLHLERVIHFLVPTVGKKINMGCLSEGGFRNPNFPQSIWQGIPESSNRDIKSSSFLRLAIKGSTDKI